jgi:hypothetical protein
MIAADNYGWLEEFTSEGALELVVAFPLIEGGRCAALVDIPVGDTGAVVFSFRRAFPAVTFFASNIGFTPVAFTPVAFLVVVVVPLVVVGIIVFPMRVLLVGTIPLVVDGPPVEDVDDEFVLFCCARTTIGLVLLINANPIPRERIVIDDVIIAIFTKFIIIFHNTTIVLMLIVLNYEDTLLIHVPKDLTSDQKCSNFLLNVYAYS